jgi:type IV pilus assembly protein PilA
VEDLLDSVTIIRIVAGLIALVCLVVYIFYILSLYRALSRCSVASRTIQPGTVWLLLVPFVNLVWQFFVVIGLAKSLGNEFRARGIPSAEPEPGKSIGIAMCVCAACGIVPLVNLLALPANLVLWIIYWAKIAGFSRSLDQAPSTYSGTLDVPQDLPPGMHPLPPETGRPALFQAVASQPIPVYVWVLVGLAAFIPIALILMLIAIPTIGAMKIHANEVSAINSLRAITQAEIQYDSAYPASGYACTLAALGGDPNSGPPSPAAAQMLQADLASGYKSGYVFNITNCSKVTVAGTDRINGFEVTAVPVDWGKTGKRGFCSDQNGNPPKYDPAGGVDCTQTPGQ